MKAIIKSIQLKKMKNGNSYFKVSLYDEFNNYIGSFGSDAISDAVSFRTELFGIMGACNCYDLLNLSNNDKSEKEIIYYSNNTGVKFLRNKKDYYLYQLSNGNYICEKIDPATEDLLNNTNVIDHSYGKIESISSKSGVFMTRIDSESSSISYLTGQIYYGFEYLWGKGEYNLDGIVTASNSYKTFVESILTFYETSDLLKLNGNQVEKYPIVDVVLDKNDNVIGIGCEKTNFMLYKTDDSYEISDDPNLDLSRYIHRENSNKLLKKKSFFSFFHKN